ncbi:hypothetical protein, partial [Collinsella aerofaciens]|uniref:hypothetical protein n=1 Tax=Collinsella aerofaciens TaxID=74426 RepID=UPI00325AA86E
ALKVCAEVDGGGFDAAACLGAGALGDLGADAVAVGCGVPFIRGVALVSLKIKSVRETALGNLAANSLYLSKGLSKTKCLSL